MQYFETQSVESLTSQKNLNWLFQQYADFDSPVTQFYLKHQNEFVTLFGQLEVDQKTRGIVRVKAYDVARKKDTLLLKHIQQTLLSSLGSAASQWNLLADVYYMGGIQNWQAYADATLQYGQLYAHKDVKTLYETVTYLKYFTTEKRILQKGIKIVEQALAVDKSYANLLLQAQLWQKLEEYTKARKTAEASVQQAKKAGVDSKEASDMIKELEEKGSKGQ
ncbi:hypothetical protein QNI19_12450 [Cytophagaceae bacterium DM2B3-1]|uniref:Tetratricopeptide repeat protein n=1 Tax=Xanthocytophaga flava TaxID=3048013 RepID=A0ABT7CL94_9BACT|nr:hypothetical protein [Xanthocytophaga flavus]MDJ1493745.1 hypothetical protein [Xanthocytophaga flavus]